MMDDEEFLLNVLYRSAYSTAVLWKERHATVASLGRERVVSRAEWDELYRSIVAGLENPLGHDQAAAVRDGVEDALDSHRPRW
jgi:hypothetical protein